MSAQFAQVELGLTAMQKLWGDKCSGDADCPAGHWCIASGFMAPSRCQPKPKPQSTVVKYLINGVGIILIAGVVSLPFYLAYRASKKPALSGLSRRRRRRR